MTTQPTERLHALDAVRGFALLAGIVFHASLSFLPGPSLWVVADQDRSVTLAILFHVLHTFRMTTFFVIAGFFAHMSFHRVGLKAFAKDRLKRIGLPLVVGWPILFGAIVAVAIWASVSTGVKPPEPPKGAMPLAPFPLAHLWFLYVLLLLYAATLALRAALGALDGQGRIRVLADRVVRAIVGSVFSPLILGAPLALTFLVAGPWLAWMGIPTPDMSLIPNVPAAVGFGTAFIFGWLLHRQTDLLAVWERRWALNLTIAVSASATGLSIVGLTPELTPAKAGPATAFYAVCFTVAIWSWTFAFIGAALRFLSNESPVRRYLADSSYWLYLVHLPLIMALQTAVARLDMAWFVKFPLILAVAFPLMLASYHFFVRRSFIGAVLNGKKASKIARPVATLPTPEPAQ
jgi:glucans biosynthesis protein C